MNDKVIKEALKIGELAESLQNIAQSDKKQISDYSVSEIVHEAEYVLSTFLEVGHLNNEMMVDEYGDDPEAAKDMRKQYRALIRFIKKNGVA